MDEVTWQPGDQIVIATTGGINSQSENEVAIILTVATDRKTLTLNNTLKYTHFGVSERLGDWNLNFRAEVGLLTRNVIVRGSHDAQWIQKIEACKDGFDAGGPSCYRWSDTMCNVVLYSVVLYIQNKV